MSTSPYITLERADWARLREGLPLPLSQDELNALRGLNEAVSLTEVAEVYMPLDRLLNLYVTATQGLHRVTSTFLGTPEPKVPFMIGIAGSVAVGKSTTARILRALLARWPAHPRVDIVTTDGFLHPNRVLEARESMRRKGFPESYDVRRLLRFVADVKSGRSPVTAPVYSHVAYDILDGEVQTVDHPDIVIIEGLNVLQSGPSPVFVSDYFDFSIYVDASEEDLERWYVERFLQLRETVFQDPRSFFHRFASLTEKEATDMARRIWGEINAVNLRENILPTRERADLILEKGAEHSVRRVRLRKV